jgi:hypothetical protein
VFEGIGDRWYSSRVFGQIDWAPAPVARADRRTSSQLVATNDPQVPPVLLGLQDRRLSLPGQVLDGVGAE